MQWVREGLGPDSPHDTGMPQQFCTNDQGEGEVGGRVKATAFRALKGAGQGSTSELMTGVPRDSLDRMLLYL